MTKKFTEYSKFDLSDVNKEILKKWQDGDVFHKSLEIREGHPSFVFMKVLLQPMVCQVFIMLSLVPSKIFFAAIKR